jgi:hypothetical protein
MHAYTSLLQQAVLRKEEEERRKQAEEAQKERERQAEAEHEQRLAMLKLLAEVAAHTARRLPSVMEVLKEVGDRPCSA